MNALLNWPRSSEKIAPSRSRMHSSTRHALRQTDRLEREIGELLDDEQYEGHPLREALSALFQEYRDQLQQLERLTTVDTSDESLATRYEKQMQRLQKIVRVSNRYQELLRELTDALKASSAQDSLSGLTNRRLMLDRLNAQVTKSETDGSPFCIAIVHIDHFNLIKDSFGQQVRDMVLTVVSHSLTAVLRDYDLCVRWSGDEFLVLLPDATEMDSHKVAGRLSARIEGMHHCRMPEDVHPSVSIGVVEHRTGDSIEATFKRASRALYDARRSGQSLTPLTMHG